MHLHSRCVRDPDFQLHNPAHQVPIVAASSFVFDDLEHGLDLFAGRRPGHVYGRFGNPTVAAAATKIADLESHGLGRKAHGLFTASGMSAIATVLLGCVPSGQHIICRADLYGGSSSLMKMLEKRGIGLIHTDLEISEAGKLTNEVANQLVEARAAEIAMIYVETPTNPTLRLVDIRALAALATRLGALLVVDNTFATSLVQKPLEHGADIVLHSTTKYLNGHGSGVAGAIVCQDKKIFEEQLVPTYRLLGGNGNPWDAWLVLNGLKTLPLRMERHAQNAQTVAEWLSRHPRVKTVNYPGLPNHPQHQLAQRQMSSGGGMLSFELTDGAAARRCMDRMKFCVLTPTLGDVDTLVLYPAGMSHRDLDPEVRAAHGITDGLLRLSVGIEAVEDIIADLEQALA